VSHFNQRATTLCTTSTPNVFEIEVQLRHVFDADVNELQNKKLMTP
jgi:hypothetical protein